MERGIVRSVWAFLVLQAVGVGPDDIVDFPGAVSLRWPEWVVYGGFLLPSTLEAIPD